MGSVCVVVCLCIFFSFLGGKVKGGVYLCVRVSVCAVNS